MPELKNKISAAVDAFLYEINTGVESIGLLPRIAMSFGVEELDLRRALRKDGRWEGSIEYAVDAIRIKEEDPPQEEES